MTHFLAGVIGDGSEFFVLPRAFGAAKIPAKYGVQSGDDALLTYSTVRGVVCGAVVCCNSNYVCVKVEKFVPEKLRAAFKEVTERL